jgi:hypothetical protein
VVVAVKDVVLAEAVGVAARLRAVARSRLRGGTRAAVACHIFPACAALCPTSAMMLVEMDLLDALLGLAQRETGQKLRLPK